MRPRWGKANGGQNMSKQFPPDGERVEKVEIFAGGLPLATGMVVGGDGALYVSVNGATAGNGAVWRMVP
jgi:hypothetical protein